MFWSAEKKKEYQTKIRRSTAAENILIQTVANKGSLDAAIKVIAIAIKSAGLSLTK